MDTRIKFLYLSEPDMIKAGVKNMDQCVEAMEDLGYIEQRRLCDGRSQP